MKLDTNTINPDTLVQEIKIPYEYKLVDKFVPKIDGGKIFRYDLITGKVSLVDFRKNEDYVLGGENRPQLDMEKNSLYVEAINLKNAIRKFKNGRYDFRY